MEKNKTGKELERRNSNQGSAMVFMAVLLIPLCIFFCMIIRYAQLAAGKGAAADAIGLADNAVCASYNKPIKEAYGLTCYTDSAETMTGMAEQYANRSLNVEGQADLTVSYGGTLADDRVLMEQIWEYMSDWDQVVPLLTTDQITTLKEKRDKAVVIKDALLIDFYELECRRDQILGKTEEAVPEEDKTEEQKAAEEEAAQKQAQEREEAERARLRAFGVAGEDPHAINPENLKLELQGKTWSYSGNISRMDSWDTVFTSVMDMDESEENVVMASRTLEVAINYLDPLDNVQQYLNRGTYGYYVALYANNNFSSFHAYGNGTLTGKEYGGGDMPSVFLWGEQEFLAIGDNYEDSNNYAVKNMIYDILFMDYITSLYDTVMNDAQIQAYAKTLSDGNPYLEAIYRDEFLIGMSAQMTYKALVAIYNWEDNPEIVIRNYPAYMELFLLITSCNDFDGLLVRIRYVIEQNAKNSSSAEARAFSFADAHTDPAIMDYRVRLRPSFGGAVTVRKQ